MTLHFMWYRFSLAARRAPQPDPIPAEVIRIAKQIVISGRVLVIFRMILTNGFLGLSLELQTRVIGYLAWLKSSSNSNWTNFSTRLYVTITQNGFSRENPRKYS